MLHYESVCSFTSRWNSAQVLHDRLQYCLAPKTIIFMSTFDLFCVIIQAIYHSYTSSSMYVISQSELFQLLKSKWHPQKQKSPVQPKKNGGTPTRCNYATLGFFTAGNSHTGRSCQTSTGRISVFGTSSDPTFSSGNRFWGVEALGTCRLEEWI